MFCDNGVSGATSLNHLRSSAVVHGVFMRVIGDICTSGCPLCLARRAKRALLPSELRQAVLEREARRTWNGGVGVR